MVGTAFKDPVDPNDTVDVGLVTEGASSHSKFRLFSLSLLLPESLLCIRW